MTLSPSKFILIGHAMVVSIITEQTIDARYERRKTGWKKAFERVTERHGGEKIPVKHLYRRQYQMAGGRGGAQTLLQFLLQFGRKIEAVSATCEKYERVEKYQKAKTDGELEITSRL